METRFFKGKNILIISPEPWAHLFVSKHHYAIELSRHNKVFFLNPPADKFLVNDTQYKNVWEINYPAFVKGLRFFPQVLQRYIMKQKYKAIQKLAGVEFDCVWSFDNSVFFDFSILPKHVLAISHIVDYSQNFQLERAARTARLCMGVSENIVKLLKPHNSRTFLMPHGFALHRYEQLDVELPGQNKIKAIFAGNLDRKHFDKDVLIKLAETFPQVDFIFYGSGGKDWKRLNNIFYPGVVKAELLHNYLKKADVLLLPYKVDDFPLELTNSHKVLEYLHSGTIGLSSFLADYEDKPTLLKMVNKNSDFPAAFGEIISDLQRFNSEDNKILRRAYAEQNTYVKRLEEIEALISRSK